MALPQVNSADAVLAAVDEYDKIGGPAFHEKYGFGPADEYFALARGRLYDSKAILAAAQGYEHPELGPARNEFVGGGGVQRRLEQLGFEVLVDRRCGDFLKRLQGIRVASEGGAERVYKPLLLLLAVGRAAHSQPQLGGFAEFEQALAPLLERFAGNHGESAIQNAWWRLPGDGLWNVFAEHGEILRESGERARTNPPSTSELRSTTGGFPDRFEEALRQVPALRATAAAVLVERFFRDSEAADKQALFELASEHGLVAETDVIHLIVKWTPRFNAETDVRHLDVAEKHGAVWWGLLTKSGERSLSEAREAQLREQLEAGHETFAFIVGQAGNLKCWRARVANLTVDRSVVDPELVPTYYSEDWQFGLWLELSDFRQIARDELYRLLDPDAKPGQPIALMNQTNPLFVRFRTTPRYWWVNQGASFQRAREGRFLWAPLLDKVGRPKDHWQTMRHVRPGDVVFNYANGQIRATSVALDNAMPATRPDPEADQAWSDDGLRVELDWRDLREPVKLVDIPAEWRTNERAFAGDGSVNQGYLFPLSDGFVSKLAGRFRQLLDGDPPPPTKPSQTGWVEPPFSDIAVSIASSGMTLNSNLLRRYHVSLKTRGFVVLSGVSGTGKTWLAQAYADAVGARAIVVPVAPNWTTNEDPLGYLNPLNSRYQDTAFSLFLRDAASEFEEATTQGVEPLPFHLILDEMNLARVEYYFAKFLSAMELRTRSTDATIELAPGDLVQLPPSLKFVGTVNVDETTHGFADKVYDRSQLIEMTIDRAAVERHLEGRPFSELVGGIWTALAEVAPFAFRVLDEITSYVDEAARISVGWEEALDEQLLQKVLPKIKGTDLRIAPALREVRELTADRFPLTHQKASTMLATFDEHAFTSYF